MDLQQLRINRMPVIQNAKCSSCAHYDGNAQSKGGACDIGTSPSQCGSGVDTKFGYAPLSELGPDEIDDIATPAVNGPQGVMNEYGKMESPIVMVPVVLGDEDLSLAKRIYGTLSQTTYKSMRSQMTGQTNYYAQVERANEVYRDDATLMFDVAKALREDYFSPRKMAKFAIGDVLHFLKERGMPVTEQDIAKGGPGSGPRHGVPRGPYKKRGVAASGETDATVSPKGETPSVPKAAKIASPPTAGEGTAAAEKPVPAAKKIAAPAPASGGADDFHKHVQEAVNNAPAEHGFGSQKVFIHHAHEAVKRQYPNMSLPEFKEKINKERARGKLTLSRADMPSLMDPKKVAASEHNSMGDSVHFIHRDHASAQKLRDQESQEPQKKPATEAEIRHAKNTAAMQEGIKRNEALTKEWKEKEKASKPATKPAPAEKEKTSHEKEVEAWKNQTGKYASKMAPDAERLKAQADESDRLVARDAAKQAPAKKPSARPDPQAQRKADFEKRSAEAKPEAAKPPSAKPAATASDADFHKHVQAAVDAAPPSHGHGDSKVFIHHAHEAIKKQYPNMSLPEFKKRVNEERTKGNLVLSRADFPSAMDVSKVTASEHNHMGDSVHFINRTPQTRKKSMPEATLLKSSAAPHAERIG